MIVDLASHVRVCSVADWIVFLDLRRDRYSAIAQTGVALVETKASSGRCLDVSGSHLLAVLTECGMLAKETAPACDLSQRRDRQMPLRLRAPCWLAALRARLWASAIVNAGNLDRAFSEIGRLKRRVGSAPSPNASEHAIKAFSVLDPWFPGRRACLSDSLAFTRFLLSRRVMADCVIGVTARPFSAHCWVEHDGRVLNDEADIRTTFVEIARA